MAVWKRKDTGNWVCDFRHNNQLYVRTLKFARTRKEAEQVIMADVFRQVYGLEGKKDCPFEQFVVDNFLPYSEANKKTFYDDVLVCRVLVQFFKGRNLRSITPALVEEFKQRRLATPVRAQGKKPDPDKPRRPRSPATVNREMNVLSKIFSLAIDAELLDDNPCRRVKRLRMANNRVRYLTHEEEKSLFDELEGYDWVKQMVVMAINRGMRRGEIFDLKWFDVDLNRNVLHVRQSKPGRARTVPLNATVHSLLESVPKTSELCLRQSQDGRACHRRWTAIRAGIKEGKDHGFSFP